MDPMGYDNYPWNWHMKISGQWIMIIYHNSPSFMDYEPLLTIIFITIILGRSIKSVLSPLQAQYVSCTIGTMLDVMEFPLSFQGLLELRRAMYAANELTLRPPVELPVHLYQVCIHRAQQEASAMLQDPFRGPGRLTETHISWVAHGRCGGHRRVSYQMKMVTNGLYEFICGTFERFGSIIFRFSFCHVGSVHIRFGSITVRFHHFPVQFLPCRFGSYTVRVHHFPVRFRPCRFGSITARFLLVRFAGSRFGSAAILWRQFRFRARQLVTWGSSLESHALFMKDFLEPSTCSPSSLWTPPRTAPWTAKKNVVKLNTTNLYKLKLH